MEEPKSLSILNHFSSLSDPRIERNKLHPLENILTISICSIICGAEGWEDMELFDKSKKEWFESFLDLKNVIPGHDTFRRVLSSIDPIQFRECFSSWMNAVHEATQGEIIPIDGKTLRRSFDKATGKSAIHMVSAWSSQDHLVLGQIKVDDKSNEITAIPKLLDLLSIKGCIVTIDAMGCQKTIAAKIRKNEGDYVLALKGNQGSMHEEIIRQFDGASDDLLNTRTDDHFQVTSADHGRIEVRDYWITSKIDWLTGKENWQDLNSVIITQNNFETGGKQTFERRYYITSLNSSAKIAGNAVRSHWSIENSLHWCLDVTFREDLSRIRKDHGPENLATLRHIGLNLLKKETSRKLSVRKQRLLASWENDYLVKIITNM